MDKVNDNDALAERTAEGLHDSSSANCVTSCVEQLRRDEETAVFITHTRVEAADTHKCGENDQSLCLQMFSSDPVDARGNWRAAPRRRRADVKADGRTEMTDGTAMIVKF